MRLSVTPIAYPIIVVVVLSILIVRQDELSPHLKEGLRMLSPLEF
jgi:hypothetical protein